MIFPGSRWLRRVTIVAAVLTLWVVWDNWGDLLLSPTEVSTSASTSSPDTLERGHYLVRAGNCIACHTERGGPPLAGGRAIWTPFGPVYSSNLTPDKSTGLGAWSAHDFWIALHHGRSRSGRLLTPAFPYEHTSLITREDSDAMFAWLSSQPAVQQAQRPHGLTWPVGTPVALAIWRSLYFSPRTFQPDPQQTHEWNRGAYLVQSLGHCAACHSPRNALGASAGVKDLSGGLMPVLNWYAPNLWSDQESGLASTPLTDIVKLLKTGAQGEARTSGPMAEVVQHSLQHLTDADLNAMALYLQIQARQMPPEPPRIDAPAPSKRLVEQGARIYDKHCAHCHGEEGQGVRDAYPALRSLRGVQLSDPTNAVQAVLYGGYGPSTEGHPRPFGMPPFILVLNDEELAAVLTHVRHSMQPPGQRASEVTPLQVNRIRAKGSP
jgi:mono/diheme cytochrome c family protein